MTERSLDSLEYDLVPGADTLYIFFGGISSGISMPPFEFYNSSRILDASKIFVRDFNQTWYHQGLCGYTENIPETAKYLSGEIDRLNVENVFLVGNSMGGYAAILFSQLIGQGSVIAFSPQTFIARSLREQHRDRRWGEQIANTHRVAENNYYFNLRKFLVNNRNPVHIYASKKSRLDVLHAQHLSGLPNIEMTLLDRGGHAVVRVLKKQGMLANVMRGLPARAA